MPKKNNNSNAPWSTPESIRSHLQKRWDKGVFLNAEASVTFPYVYPIKGPSAAEITDCYADVTHWADSYRALDSFNGVQVIWTERSHRLSGKNHIPSQLSFASTHDLAHFVGRLREWENWNAALNIIQNTLPDLIPYWLKHPVQGIPLCHDLQKLTRLVRVCEWCRRYTQNATERIYIRQIPLEGIHTKFVESNQSILAMWLDYLCSDHFCDLGPTKGLTFAKRFGFLEKPQLVRIRLLDSKYYWNGLSDLTLVAHELASLEWPVKNVFICENDVTCLSFPTVPDSLLIFGGGYGFDALSRIPWLQSKRIFYWGDLDTNGFCILDQLKSHFPHTQSFLMDTHTLLRYKEYWSREGRPMCRNLLRLNPAERMTYQELCQHTWGKNVRLEQELIPISEVQKALRELGF